MIDKLFLVNLILNATGLFRFLAPQFGVEIGNISFALLAFNAYYLLTKWSHLTLLFRRTDMRYWAFILVLWPFYTILYAPSLEIREVGLALYYFSLFCGAVVYTMANGLTAMHRIVSISLGISAVGLVLSMVVPEYFQRVALLADARTMYLGRSFGFFMQPNAAAIGFALLFFGWFSLWRHKNTIMGVVALVTFLGLILLTGSRVGVVVAVVVIGLLLASSWRSQLPPILAFRRSYLKVLLLGACLLGGLFWTTRYLSSADYKEGSLLDRISMLMRFRLAASCIREDKSVRYRLAAQRVYWALIKKEPLSGHGLGAETHYSENGPIDRTSHSTILTCWMEYGIFYPIALCLLMVRLYLSRRRARAEGAFGSNSIFQFVFIVLFLFTASGNLLSARVFYVVWAMFFAAVCCPRHVFSHDESTGRISGVLTRREVARRFARGRRLQKVMEPSIQGENALAPEGGTDG
jgi:hypothetical protein